MTEVSSEIQDTVKGKEFKARKNNLAAIRNRLIVSIAKDGLRSSRSLEREGEESFRSIDTESFEGVYGRTFKPKRFYPNENLFDNSVKHALYMTDNSILPVIVERQGESSEDSRLYKANTDSIEIVEDRLKSSMLVVYDGNESDSYYTRNEEELGPDKIICILLPKEVVDDLGQDQVDNLDIEIRVVNDEIERSLFHGDRLRMPNYEEEIKRLLLEQDRSFWIHGVRLPTIHDLEVDEEVAT